MIKDREMLETVPGMFSSDYFERLMSEEQQLVIRLKRIHDDIEYSILREGEYELLKEQEKAMMAYPKALRRRIHQERFYRSTSQTKSLTSQTKFDIILLSLL